MQDAASSLPSGRALNEQEAPRSSLRASEGSELPRGPYSDRVQCTSCNGTGSTGEHGCTDCLGKGLDHAAFVGGIEQALNDAYAEGRKDEAEERGVSRPDWQDVQRVLGYLKADEAEIRSKTVPIVWADTMARAADLIRNLAPERRHCDCAKRLAGRVDGDVHLEGCSYFALRQLAQPSNEHSQLSVNARRAPTDGAQPHDQGEAS